MTTIVADENGLTVGTQAEMIEEAKVVFIGAFGDLARVEESKSPEGQIARILGEMKTGLGEHLQAMVSGLLPSKATKVLLSELVKFNGIERNTKEYSTGVLSCTALPTGCTIPAGDIIETVAGDQFKTDIELVLTASETDTVPVTAVEPGAINASAGAVTIVTPEYGWASASLASDVIPGKLDESDPALRARRWRAAVGVGLHHPSMIRKALENLPDVTAVYVEENKGTTYNEHGVPPQHVRAIVRGGTAADIAAVLFGSYAPFAGAGSIAGGVGSWGSQTMHVVDAVSGQEGDINYDTSVDVPIYVIVRTRKIPGQYPADGDAKIKQFIMEQFSGELEIEGGMVEGAKLGGDVYGTDLAAGAKAVPGHKIERIYVGLSAGPTAEMVEIDVDEFPVTSSSLITIQGV